MLLGILLTRSILPLMLGQAGGMNINKEITPGN
jgi:hypothetical protein